MKKAKFIKEQKKKMHHRGKTHKCNIIYTVTIIQNDRN